MNRFYLMSLTVLALVGFISITGFQCGSAEVTSAKLYLQREDWPNAERALAKETEKNPANAEAWYLLGQTRLKRGDISEKLNDVDSMGIHFRGMLDAYKKSLEISKEAEPKINIEWIYAWQKSLNYGVNLFNSSIKAAAASKEDASAMRKNALKAYELAIALMPDSIVAYENAAYALHADGQIEKEMEYLQKARKIRPTLDVLISIINYNRQKAGDALAKNDSATALTYFDLSIADLKEARNMDPQNKDLLDVMTDSYLKAGRTSEAKSIMREGLVLDPANKLYQYNLGVLLMESDSLTEALNHFNAALQTDPNYEVALQNAAVSEMRMGDKIKKAAQDDTKKSGDKSYLVHFKKAVGYFEKLTGLKPEEPSFWEYLATAYLNVGNLKRAQTAVDIADVVRAASVANIETAISKKLGKPATMTSTVFKTLNTTVYTFPSKGLELYVSNGKLVGYKLTQ